MKDLMKEAGLPEPLFSTEGMFTVTLKRPLKTVEETVEELIKSLIKANPKIIAREIMKATGLSRRGVEYRLNKMKASGKIARIGSTKGGYWELKK